jgi:hypothetical protein
MMASNFREAGMRVTGQYAGGSTSFLKNDIVGDQYRLLDSITNVNRLLSNVGPADLASNFLLEQKNIMRAHAKENRQIRDLLEEKVSDHSLQKRKY